MEEAYPILEQTWDLGMLQMDCCGCPCLVEPVLAVACLPHMRFWLLYHYHSDPEDVGECCHRAVRHQNRDLNDVPWILV